MCKILTCVVALQLAYSSSLTSAPEASKPAAKSLYSISHFGQPARAGTYIAANDVPAQNQPIGPGEYGNTPEAAPGAAPEASVTTLQQGSVINFNNVNITEFLRFVGRLTGRNFIYDPQELQFPVTIISEVPASPENVMAALLQNLRIHGYFLLEEGKSLVIHRNETLKAPANLWTKDTSLDIATLVYQFAHVSPSSVSTLISSMTSADAIVQVVDENLSIVVTDITANLIKIQELIKKLDAPTSGLEIGQYVALNNSPATLLAVVARIMAPLAGDKPLVLVPYTASNSIFIVSTPFLLEKTLSILQSLDLTQATSGTLNIEGMKFNSEVAAKAIQAQHAEVERVRETPVPLTPEEVEQLTAEQKAAILRARGLQAEQLAKLSHQQITNILMTKGLSPAEREKILGQKTGVFASELPLGQVESTQFFIHKLQFRKATEIAKALQAIAISLAGPPGSLTQRALTQPSDLSVTLSSVQVLEENNSIVFTGTRATLQKVKDLIAQLDTQVRQVMIEALVLDASLQESLNFGVEWGAKLQRKNFAGQVGLTGLNSPVTGPLSAITFPGCSTTPTVGCPQVLTPIPINEGFSATAIGRKIKFNGTGFIAGAAFVQALQANDDTRIILNPKIVTEHNVPAEIFVGQQIPIKGQSIVNATTSTISNTVSTNYESQNVGTSLKVTPLISSNDTVTLIIEEEISNANQVQVASQGQNNAPPATVNMTTAKTRVHMPSNYYLMMSGILSTQTEAIVTKMPILGSIPIIGFFFSQKVITTQKRNIIMYIRPRILDTPADIEDISADEERFWRDSTDKAEGFRHQMDIIRMLLNIGPDDVGHPNPPSCQY
ncbi:MAG: hypothetical protein JSR46_00920 [Verrucomicrobia bacterium]|nr:hypothetical protein [Verrucomicrobiota bacterium]